MHVSFQAFCGKVIHWRVLDSPWNWDPVRACFQKGYTERRHGEIGKPGDVGTYLCSGESGGVDPEIIPIYTLVMVPVFTLQAPLSTSKGWGHALGECIRMFRDQSLSCDECQSSSKSNLQTV